jgi:hypothetical protein
VKGRKTRETSKEGENKGENQEGERERQAEEMTNKEKEGRNNYKQNE